MTEPIQIFGQCSHFEDTPKEKQYAVMHPKQDYTGDCHQVYLACDMCRLHLVAVMQDQFNQFQNGEACDVMECFDGHRFPSFCQYTVLLIEFDDVDTNTN